MEQFNHEPAIRRGDMVQAEVDNGAVAAGTMGRVLAVVHSPTLPKMVQVEWTLVTRPSRKPLTKRSWVYTSHVSPLSSD